MPLSRFPLSSVEPGMAAAGLGTLGFAYVLGGPLWAGLAACVVGGAALAHQRQMAAIAEHRQAQSTLAGLLHGPGRIEDLATIKAEGWEAQGPFELLLALKEACGGESVESIHKAASPNQTVAVAPGITFTIAHDAGVWFTQLSLKGTSARRFLPGAGGPAQWHGRGASPQEALEALARAMGKSRRAALVEGYAQRVLEDDAAG
ncbi:MAG: hypothetical protein VKQ33_08240 [Candidatus Sericytochromatia bacterium]|nr:hypothetical protein [Candidatus Sericytochromatia bacterium]